MYKLGNVSFFMFLMTHVWGWCSLFQCGIQAYEKNSMQYSTPSHIWYAVFKLFHMENRIHHKNMCFEKLTIFSNARLQNPLYISLCLKKLSSRPHPEFEIEF